MNAPLDPQAPARSDAGLEPPPRLREIPYNYTSLADREVVHPPAGRRGLAHARRSCAASGAPGAARACSTRCWATSGWCSATPTCRTTCSTIRAAARRWSGRCGTGCARSSVRREPDDAERDRKVGELLDATRKAVRDFEAAFGATADLRRRARRLLRRPHARRTTCASTPSRAWRTSRTPPTGASSTPSWCSTRTREEEIPRLVRDCIELGLTVIPRGGGTGYTGGAIPLTPRQRRDQYGEARALRRASNARTWPAWRLPFPRSSPKPAW